MHITPPVALGKCLSIRQDDDAVYYALSQLELMRENKDASANYILKAAEIDSKNTWYIQELAYMYYDQGDLEKSIQNFKKLVDLEPRNLDWQYGYAGVLQESGKYSHLLLTIMIDGVHLFNMVN